MKRLLFCSLEPWDNVWRRNQFICDGLLNKHEDLEILWVSPPIDLWRPTGAPDSFRYEESHPPGHIKTVRPRLHILKTYKLLPNMVGQRINDGAMRNKVRVLLKRLGWNFYTVWLNNQSMVHWLPDQTRPIVYDITDDWSSSSLGQRQAERVLRDDKLATDLASAVIVCSGKLYELKRSGSKAVYQVANGVDAEFYAPERLAILPTPLDLADVKKPIAGYVGTLHDDRMDMDLLVGTATALPDISFVLVGPNCLTAKSNGRLNQLPNVHTLGARAYDDIPSYIAAFDVCIVPHAINDFTDSLDPIKLYEYAATGKPIVSTACAGFRDHSEFVNVGSTEGFSRLIQEAIKGSGKPLQAQLEWSREQTWESRINQIEKILGWVPR